MPDFLVVNFDMSLNLLFMTWNRIDGSEIINGPVTSLNMHELDRLDVRIYKYHPCT